MSDLRTRLADALQRELDEHGYEDDDEKRGQVAHHFADVLLSLPGIAIVELPDVPNMGVGIGLGVWQGTELFPQKARELAVELLAAANAAERKGGLSDPIEKV